MANYFGETPSGRFIEAVLADDIATARALLDSHREILTDRDETGGSVLCYLAIEGWLEGVRLLLDGGFDLRGDRDHYGETPLHAAAQMGHAEICELLIARGAELGPPPGVEGKSPLHGAARHADARTVHLLLDHGADVDAVDPVSDSTPLHAACESGNLETASALLERGADPRSLDSFEEPPLFRIQDDLPSILELFERHGFALDTRDYWGKTLLDTAAYFGLLRVTEALLARGLDPRDPRDRDGPTPVDALLLGWEEQVRGGNEQGFRAVAALFGVELPEIGSAPPRSDGAEAGDAV